MKENITSNTKSLKYLGQVSGFRLYASEQIEQVASHWQTLQKTARHTPFQSYEWLSTAAAHSPRSAKEKPLLVIGYQEDEVAFLLPMATVKSSRGTRLTWIGNHINDYNAPLISDAAIRVLTPNTATQILELIALRTPNVDSVELSNQPATLADRENPFLTENQPTGSCCSYRLSLHASWPTLYRQLRKAKTRQRLKQKSRRLQRYGRVSFRSIKQQSEKADVIQTLFKWKATQLLARGDRNPFDASLDSELEPSELQRVTQQYLNNKESRRLLRVYGLFVGDELVSGMIAFTNRSSFSVFVNAYAPDRFSNCSPGVLLILKTMETASRCGCSYYDFLSGDEAYKREWSNETIQLHNCYMGFTKVGKLRVATKHAMLSLKKKLKSSPMAMRILRTMNQYRHLPLKRQLS